MENVSNLFVLDQADRSRYTLGDEIILRLRFGQYSYDVTGSLTEGLDSGRYRAVGV